MKRATLPKPFDIAPLRAREHAITDARAHFAAATTPGARAYIVSGSAAQAELLASTAARWLNVLAADPTAPAAVRFRAGQLLVEAVALRDAARAALGRCMTSGGGRVVPMPPRLPVLPRRMSRTKPANDAKRAEVY